MQREVDGRALNFYLFKNGSVSFSDDLPQIEMKADESPLVRASLSVEGEKPLHPVLAAVRGRVFCVSFSRPPQNKTAQFKCLTPNNHGGPRWFFTRGRPTKRPTRTRARATCFMNSHRRPR